MGRKRKRVHGITSQQAGDMLNAWLDCDEEDRSTEYMLQYMQDMAGVDLDTVLAFIEESPDGHLSKAVYWGDKFGEPIPDDLRIAAKQEQKELQQLQPTN